MTGTAQAIVSRQGSRNGGGLRRAAATLLLSGLMLAGTPGLVATSSGDRPIATPIAALPPALLAEVATVSPPSADGAVFVADPRGGVRAERGGRVVRTRMPTVQARFSAGRLPAGGDLFSGSRAPGDRDMRTALAGPSAFGALAREASLFRRSGTEAATADATMVADLKPSVADAPARRAVAGRPETVATEALTVAAAYAPAEPSAVGSLFDSVLGRDPAGFVPPIGKKDHSWAASVLPPSSFSAAEQTCLANGIYFEARGETELGQAAVAQVILNRVRNPSYPKTICGVVYQNKTWRNRCQFSFACDGIPDRIWNKRAFETAQRIAHEVTVGETWLPEVGSATHYHATYVNPRWAKTMQRVDKIGLHVFYRTFGGGWR